MRASLYFVCMTHAQDMEEHPKKCMCMYGMVFLAFPENFMKIGGKKLSNMSRAR